MRHRFSQKRLQRAPPVYEGSGESCGAAQRLDTCPVCCVVHVLRGRGALTAERCASGSRASPTATSLDSPARRELSALFIKERKRLPPQALRGVCANDRGHRRRENHTMHRLVRLLVRRAFMGRSPGCLLRGPQCRCQPPQPTRLPSAISPRLRAAARSSAPCVGVDPGGPRPPPPP